VAGLRFEEECGTERKVGTSAEVVEFYQSMKVKKDTCECLGRGRGARPSFGFPSTWKASAGWDGQQVRQGTVLYEFCLDAELMPAVIIGGTYHLLVYLVAPHWTEEPRKRGFGRTVDWPMIADAFRGVQGRW
jgi:hypothetical protein